MGSVPPPPSVSPPYMTDCQGEKGGQSPI